MTIGKAFEKGFQDSKQIIEENRKIGYKKAIDDIVEEIEKVREAYIFAKIAPYKKEMFRNELYNVVQMVKRMR